MTSWEDSSTTRKSRGTIRSPISNGVSVKSARNGLDSPLTTLFRHLVGTIRIFSFSTTFLDMTFGITPEWNKSKVPSDYTITRNDRFLDIEIPCTLSLSEKFTIGRIFLPDNISAGPRSLNRHRLVRFERMLSELMLVIGCSPNYIVLHDGVMLRLVRYSSNY